MVNWVFQKTEHFRLFPDNLAVLTCNWDVVNKAIAGTIFLMAS